MSKPSAFVDRFDYRVDILPRRNQITVRAADRVIAQTTQPLLVDEQDHGLVVYVPETDVDLAALTPIDLVTTCPYKGDAAHWALAGSDEPVAWTYRDPHPEVARLAGHIAFYQNQLSVELGVATPAVVGYAS